MLASIVCILASAVPVLASTVLILASAVPMLASAVLMLALTIPMLQCQTPKTGNPVPVAIFHLRS